MEYSIKEDKINTVLTSVNLETKIDGGNIEVVMGDGAKINTNDALTYIKSGEVEIENAVNAGKIVVGQEVHKANIWAEGTDAEVQALGGEHSAKGWAEESKDPMKWGNISGTLSNQTDLQNALNEKQDTLTFDNTPTQNSDNPVKSGGVYTSLSGKQNTLTFDDTPTQSSNNPVKSGGIYTALSGKVNNTGNETVAGNKTFTGEIIRQFYSLAYAGIKVKNTSITKGTTPSTDTGGLFTFQDSTTGTAASSRIGGIESAYKSNGDIITRLEAYKPTANSTEFTSIDIVYKADGTKYATAPTPATGDSSNKIATTAYVNNKFVEVNALPASPDPDTWYAIPEE